MNADEQFFYDNAGWGYDPATETPEQGRERGAVLLARAEAYARRECWYVSWEQEQQPDLSWCKDCTDGSHDEYEHMNETESAVLYDADGNVLASVGNVDRPSEQYRRVVAAELALEAMPDTVQHGGVTRTVQCSNCSTELQVSGDGTQAEQDALIRAQGWSGTSEGYSNEHGTVYSYQCPDCGRGDNQ